MNSTRPTVLKLYKQLIRECQKFTLYNYREYFLRRVRQDFRANRSIQDQTKILDLIKRAQDNLEVIRRQVIIGELYAPAQGSVIENQHT